MKIAVEGFGICWRPSSFYEIKLGPEPDQLSCALLEDSPDPVTLKPGDPYDPGAIRREGNGWQRGQTGAQIGWSGSEEVPREQVALGPLTRRWEIVTVTVRVPLLAGFVAHPSSADEDALLCFSDDGERGILVAVNESRDSPPPYPEVLKREKPNMLSEAPGFYEAAETDELGNPTTQIWQWFQRDRYWYCVFGGAVQEDREALLAAQNQLIAGLKPA